MRRLYTALLYLALPLASLILFVRGLREREYWRGWGERFGGGARGARGGVWVHAVSVGEVQVATVLIEALARVHPDWPVSISSATPTGRLRARAQLPGVDARYAPYDLPGCIRRRLRALQPRVLVLIETELWPNLLHEARRAGVPVLIASARLSERSLRRHLRFPGLLRGSLGEAVWVGAQTERDAQRFASLGVSPERIRCSGNLKFDRTAAAGLEALGAGLRARYARGRPLWVAGSTHAGEEAQVLAAQRRLLPQCRPLLVLAPRHPNRFDSAAATVAEYGLSCLRRSQDTAGGAALPAAADVLLLDTLGELMGFYAAADLAFVGGSLVPVGGHNLLEPAALGIAVATGPHQFNSPEVARMLVAGGGLVMVRDAAGLAAAAGDLLRDPAARARIGQAARAVVDTHRGATARLLAMLEMLATRMPAAAGTFSSRDVQ